MSHNRGLRMRVSGLKSVVNCKETGSITLRAIMVGSSCIVLYPSINLSTEQLEVKVTSAPGLGVGFPQK